MTRIKELAVDGIRRVERTQAVKDAVTPRNILIVLVLLAAFAWCGHHEREIGRRESASAETIERHRWEDSALALRNTQITDEQQVVTTQKVATVARTAHAKAAARLTIVGSEIAIDGGEPSALVPAAPVIQELQTAKAADLADSLRDLALVGLLATTKQEIAIQTEIAADATAQAKRGMGVRAKAKGGGGDARRARRRETHHRRGSGVQMSDNIDALLAKYGPPSSAPTPSRPAPAAPPVPSRPAPQIIPQIIPPTAPPKKRSLAARVGAWFNRPLF